MAQINPVRRLSLSLSSQKAGQKQKGQILAVSAQLMALVSALRSLSSVALSSARVSPVYHPFLTPLRQGDISTLQNRGHLYFALTGGVLVTDSKRMHGMKMYFLRRNLNVGSIIDAYVRILW